MSQDQPPVTYTGPDRREVPPPSAATSAQKGGRAAIASMAAVMLPGILMWLAMPENINNMLAAFPALVPYMAIVTPVITGIAIFGQDYIKRMRAQSAEQRENVSVR